MMDSREKPHFGTRAVARRGLGTTMEGGVKQANIYDGSPRKTSIQDACRCQAEPGNKYRGRVKQANIYGGNRGKTAILVSRRGGKSKPGGLLIRQDVHDVAVLDEVGLALEAVDALGLGLFHGAKLLELFIGDDLGADEAFGEVGVDLGGAGLGVVALVDRPGA